VSHAPVHVRDATNSFTDNMVVGIKANEDRIRDVLQRSLMLVTALSASIGYDNAAQVAKAAQRQ
jgi:fumarate hydratase class II